MNEKNIFESTGVRNLKIRNGVYYWRQHINGTQYSESLQTRDKEQAVRTMEQRRKQALENKGKKPMKKNANMSDEWVTFNPNLKVLDCTIRDGGLVTNCHFEDNFVRNVYQTLVEAGVDYMEVGYKADKKLFADSDAGPYKFSTEDDLRRIIGDNDTDLKISVMADTGRTDYHNDILPKEQSVIDLIRVACYIHQIPAALEMVDDAKQKGYEVALNLMAISTVPDYELDKGLEVIGAGNMDMIYLVDSFGSLYYEQIDDLLKRYLQAAGPDKQVGIHAHNNQQMAYANTTYAAIHGATVLDSTIYGLGRGAGNCYTELLLGFLKNPKFKLRPILKCIERDVLPLREKYDWGYSTPYMITGMLNEHPRAAIALRESDRKDECVAFYDEMINP